MTKTPSSHHVIPSQPSFLANLAFPLLMGCLSRGVILLAMLGIAPLLSAPSGGVQAEWGLDVFSAWDSQAYQTIATSGYEILDNQQSGANVAFFPLYPLLIRLIMQLGLSDKVAGILVNNLAFFSALILLYGWIKQSYSQKAAKWVTAVLAWCPLSLFGTVIYTEGLFLLLTTLALFSFESRRFGWTILWGSLATATRITGLALIPAFILTAWFKKYPIKAYFPALLSSSGILAYIFYCQLTFNEPLAFITVQHRIWQRSRGIDWLAWWRMIVEIVAGSANWHYGGIKDPTHPLIFGLIVVIAILLWRFKAKLGQAKTDYGFFTLFIILWLLAGDPLLNTLSILGGCYLLWYSRRYLSFVNLMYGFCALGLILASGGTTSCNRYAYGIIPLSIALGLLFSRYNRWGYCMMGFFVVVLFTLSLRFAQHLWVA